MQYLYCALVAAVIATGVANPTADKASMSSIEDRTRAADKACMHMRNTDSNRCFEDCTYRHLGILDSEGRYVQSVIAEVLSSQFPALTQQQVTEATTTCSSALDKWVDGCGRADIVYKCIHAALEKADKASMSSIEDRTRAAVKACMHMRNTDSNRCFEDCTYRHLGILDSEGRYVQSVIAEVLSSQFPALTQQQVTEATTTCSSALDKWVDGCGRADIVYECIHAALEKMTGKKFQ